MDHTHSTALTLTVFSSGRWPRPVDEGVCGDFAAFLNSTPATDYYQIGPAIIGRQQLRLRTVALTAAIAARTGLMLNSVYLPWIGEYTPRRAPLHLSIASSLYSPCRALARSEWPTHALLRHRGD